MAEIQQTQSRNRRGVQRSKKLSTRIDLTPMVDLGFLLITFFIFTTTLSEQKAMGLILPNENTKDSSEVADSKVLNLVLKENNSIVCYNGKDAAHAFKATYNPESLRNTILQKRAIVAAKFGNANETIILIKPTVEATYGNIVTVLDEMQINTIKKYVLMQPTIAEAALQ